MEIIKDLFEETHLVIISDNYGSDEERCDLLQCNTVSEIKLQNCCFELHIILESQFKSFPLILVKFTPSLTFPNNQRW